MLSVAVLDQNIITIALFLVFSPSLLMAEESEDSRKSDVTQPQGLVIGEAGRPYIHDWTFTVLSIEKDQEREYIIKYSLKYLSPESLRQLHDYPGSKREPQYVTVKGQERLDRMDKESRNGNLFRAFISLSAVDLVDKEALEKIPKDPLNPHPDLSMVVAQYFIPAVYLSQVEGK